MNYGAEPADQVVRYSLEGMEYSLKITEMWQSMWQSLLQPL